MARQYVATHDGRQNRARRVRAGGEPSVNLQRRDRARAWPELTILALALTTPVWMMVLVSTLTTRRQAVSLALTVPALAASAMVGAWWFLTGHPSDSAGRTRAQRVMTVSATFLRVYFLVVVP